MPHYCSLHHGYHMMRCFWVLLLTSLSASPYQFSVQCLNIKPDEQVVRRRGRRTLRCPNVKSVRHFVFQNKSSIIKNDI